MYVKISELKVGDLIKASWLGVYRGSEWHTVYEIRPSYSSSSKLNLNIEGYGNKDLDKDDRIERQ